MGLVDLFSVASVPVLKTLLLTALGSFLALDQIDVLGENARKQLNGVVFFVFNPALVSSNLARTITFESVVLLWFMPFNILGTYIIGSILGWILIKSTRAPQHIKGLIVGCCAAGNMGNLPVIIIPAICKEKGSPFGAPDVCHKYGMAYASLSMAIGAVYLWSYVYNIIRISSSKANNEDDKDEFPSDMKSNGGTTKLLEGDYPGAPLVCTKTEGIEKSSWFTEFLRLIIFLVDLLLPLNTLKVRILGKTKQCLRTISRQLNLKAIFAPSTSGAIVGFIIGVVPQLRNLMIGGSAPLRVVEDSASLLGNGAIPIVSLIVGGNLLRGLKGSGIQLSVIVGIVAVRYIFLPLLGIVIVKCAVKIGLVHADPLYQFVLLLQYALPPAINIGTITLLFGAGESECSVVMLWTYALASVSLTLWSTIFMWLVA